MLQFLKAMSSELPVLFTALADELVLVIVMSLNVTLSHPLSTIVFVEDVMVVLDFPAPLNTTECEPLPEKAEIEMLFEKVDAETLKSTSPLTPFEFKELTAAVKDAKLLPPEPEGSIV